MKRIKVLLFVTIWALFISSLAKAKDNFYFDTNLLLTESKFKYHNKSEDVGSLQGLTTSGQNLGFGFALGYQFNLSNLNLANNFIENIFIAPEIFYDSLRSQANDSSYLNGLDFANDKLKAQYRYGAKLNIGYNFTPKFNVFVNVGNVNTKWQGSYLFDGVTENGVANSAIYGIGASYKIAENFAIKTALDYQEFNMQNSFYSFNGSSINKVELQTLKVGLSYLF